MTPQELMDIEGAGNAEKALKKSGDWDEYAGLEYKTYSVTFAVMVSEERTITVKARNEDEADEKVYQQLSGDPNIYECSEEYNSIKEITT